MYIEDILNRRRQIVSENIQKGFSSEFDFDELEKGKWNVGDQKFYHGTMHYVAELKPDGSPRWRRVKKTSGGSDDASIASSTRSQIAEKPKKSGDKDDEKVKKHSEKKQSKDSKNVLKNIFSNKEKLSKFLSETENKMIGKINMSWSVGFGKDKQDCEIEIQSVPEGVKYRYKPDAYFATNPKRTETPSRGILVCAKLHGNNSTSYYEGFIGMNALLSDEQDHLLGGINGTAYSPLNSRLTKEGLLDSISKNKTAMDMADKYMKSKQDDKNLNKKTEQKNENSTKKVEQKKTLFAKNTAQRMREVLKNDGMPISDEDFEKLEIAISNDEETAKKILSIKLPEPKDVSPKSPKSTETKVVNLGNYEMICKTDKSYEYVNTLSGKPNSFILDEYSITLRDKVKGVNLIRSGGSSIVGSYNRKEKQEECIMYALYNYFERKM